MINRVIISLGSNEDPQSRLPKACMLIKRLIPEIRYSPAMETEPIDCPDSKNFFTDIIAVGFTPMSIGMLQKRLKEIECLLGRKSREKRTPGVVEIDVDLLLWNNKCLKPEDFKRPYISIGLEHLGEPVPVHL
ncbi:2-amino-4-hydroxy-6-hydroxymethyldihydropteridinediphosphokinase [Porphyromonas macacae]|uniref:2-amino-4-hydroxy-6-hydroxymethyldihydropteridine pyrophosphokinase n=1 Tax=Porphyromonas macacae TaxID=28115 RepID=A0A379E7G1_9PORP|nr:2-amino-4-hydroxy-6-hydroxymethyldihydropteridine diphosphokinase [Porphyromonas macacae]SUB88657.1 2-amino-4-hydroxy-6-hydroxymethyldihydropteridinediphosphokinase [Porphyromonas macacae]